MSTEPEKNEANSNSYVMDSESPMELARLLHQDRLFTKVLGLLPALSNPSKLRSILDVACEPVGGHGKLP